MAVWSDPLLTSKMPVVVDVLPGCSSAGVVCHVVDEFVNGSTGVP
jgi:hypothetical protein